MTAGSGRRRAESCARQLRATRQLSSQPQLDNYSSNRRFGDDVVNICEVAGKVMGRWQACAREKNGKS